MIVKTLVHFKEILLKERQVNTQSVVLNLNANVIIFFERSYRY